MTKLDRRRGSAWAGEPVEYRNRLGDSQFQPALVTGERMWLEPGWESPFSSHLNPYLTTYKRAKRLARAKSRSLYRAKYIDDYKEVS